MKLFAKIFKTKSKERDFPKGMNEIKVSEDTFVTEISKEQKDNSDIERREKDKVGQLSKLDGFHDKPNGRQGTIYYVDHGKTCELYYEISGVKEFDILIWFDQLNEWILPKNEAINQIDKQRIKEKLINWLDLTKIRAEL
ncbi:hypothetical protein [Plebeiibacterium sediminum]|uniref:Uncharacterized protein n=1 Tax=Plebeiibacterium sediminum TaxID=2992112 RepID=A0AAE3M9X8_9BACT|nr:hypothetical protein [Plebeiobacterium sediminum]MCW3789773.1 hypothetical protein [Plebeiobacterium sediminum]